MRILILSLLFSFGMTGSSIAQNSVNFTLRNTTAKSIKLWIPSVMNPNLSPFSKSGVILKIGQKIYFKHRGRKKTLLEVTTGLDGKTLNVPKLIRARKKELNL